MIIVSALLVLVVYLVYKYSITKFTAYSAPSSKILVTALDPPDQSVLRIILNGLSKQPALISRPSQDASELVRLKEENSILCRNIYILLEDPQLEPHAVLTTTLYNHLQHEEIRKVTLQLGQPSHSIKIVKISEEPSPNLYDQILSIVLKS
jgi:hypothetical protein